MATPKMTTDGRAWRAFLSMPGYDTITGGAALGFWAASRNNRVVREFCGGSLLANNFNRLWVQALNARKAGEQVDFFAMQHADIEPEPYWLDTLIEEMNRLQLDVLGVVAPIKDGNGLTSCAIDSGDNWRVKCRISMTEAARLPETFTSEDVGGKLLLNTGLWVCRFGDWCDKVHFEINDRIAFNPETDRYYAQVEPEDWYFSRLCHELELKIGATRKVRLIHRGQHPFSNYIPWGNAFDREYLSESAIPERVDRPCYETIQGYFDYDHLYEEIAEDLPDGGQFVEIGTWRGKSLAYLMESLAKRGKQVKVWGVDHFEGSPEAPPLQQMARLHDVHAECQANLARVGYPFKLIKGKSAPAADQFADASLDALFIDGGHEYDAVRADLLAWLPKVKPGGIVSGHDFHMESVQRAVVELAPSAKPSPRPDGSFEWGLCWKYRKPA